MTDVVEKKITFAEVMEIFGETVPIEVVNLLYGEGNEGMTIKEARAHIIEIASRHAEEKADIVERLGYNSENPATGKLELTNPDGPEAAAEITRLRADREAVIRECAAVAESKRILGRTGKLSICDYNHAIDDAAHAILGLIEQGDRS